MTRNEITLEIQNRLDRHSTSDKTQIENWINRIIKDVERLYAFKYTRRRKTSAIAAGTAEYTLPTDLIYHLSFKILIQDSTDTDVYYHTFNLEDIAYDYHITDKGQEATYPIYFVQEGGVDGLVFRFHPVPDETLTMQIQGHFYTPDFEIGSGGDNSTNWLTNEYPDIVIEGVAAIAFKHFEEWQNAEAARKTYQDYLNGNTVLGINGLVPSERRRAFRSMSQIPRVKTLDDFPFKTQEKLKRRFGI